MTNPAETRNFVPVASILDDASGLEFSETANVHPSASEDIMDDGTNFRVDEASAIPASCDDAFGWGPDGAPGFAGLFGLKPVSAPSEGSAQYDACQKLVAQIRQAFKRAGNAQTPQARFDIIARVAENLVARLDGRHSGLPLIPGDGNDPLYALMWSAKKVVGCLTYGKRKYLHAASARQRVVDIAWEEPLPGPHLDPRVEALEAFRELTQMLINVRPELHDKHA